MKNVSIYDVGDGLYLDIGTLSGELIQVDFGDRKSGKNVYDKFLCNLVNPCYPFGLPEVFILSHFHSDHYNGLNRCLNKFRIGPGPIFNIKKVYYPRLPEFPQKKEFMKCMFSMNEYIMGNDTGIMEADFFKIIYELNGHHDFERIPLSMGDSMYINGSIFNVIWPPLVIDGMLTNSVRNAIRKFHQALEIHPELREIYDGIQSDSFFKHFFKEDYEGVDETEEFEEDDLHEDEIDYYNMENDLETCNRELPYEIKLANESLRGVANRLSLCFYEDNRFLFLGDTEKHEIKKIVNDLEKKHRTKFFVMIPPHHGTHWQNELYKIRCKFSISSIGKNLIRYYQPEIKEISEKSYASYVNGDVQIDYF